MNQSKKEQQIPIRFRKCCRIEFVDDKQSVISYETTGKSWYLQEQPVMLAIVGGSWCNFDDRCFEDTEGPRKCHFRGRYKRLDAYWNFLQSLQRRMTIVYVPPSFYYCFFITVSQVSIRSFTYLYHVYCFTRFNKHFQLISFSFEIFRSKNSNQNHQLTRSLSSLN